VPVRSALGRERVRVVRDRGGFAAGAPVGGRRTSISRPARASASRTLRPDDRVPWFNP